MTHAPECECPSCDTPQARWWRGIAENRAARLAELSKVHSQLVDKCNGYIVQSARDSERLAEAERDAARYRWLAADGDRAKRILRDFSGGDIEYEIDKGIAAVSASLPPSEDA